MSGRRMRWVAVFLVVLFLNASAYASQQKYQPFQVASESMVRIPGHVLSALRRATIVPSGPNSGDQSIILTIVLKRDDQKGFERYLRELYDPHSRRFHHFLTPQQIAERFGPSAKSYGAVREYLHTQGFRLVRGSADHLTITVDGTRADAEHAFALKIGDYRIGNQDFYANGTDPELPTQLASHVQAIIGLSDLAKPKHSSERIFIQSSFAQVAGIGFIGVAVIIGSYPLLILSLLVTLLSTTFMLGMLVANSDPPSSRSVAGQRNVAAALGVGQTIGLVEFAGFQSSDVSDYLNLVAPVAQALGMPSGSINNLSVATVNGGATAGGDQQEVLLDIDDVMTLAPGAKVVAYEAPFVRGSFQAVLSAMINDGVNVISNSWAYCEDQTTLADAQSIDTILQNAAAAGITVVSGAGDHGSACLDGSPNTVAVPVDSPNLTAVGGSSFTPGNGLTYGSETWWDDSNTTPPAGQGGFGTSKFFAAKSYQSVLTGSSMRMVPDVVTNADPFHGMLICQASSGGCPNGMLYGGTSMAAPTWAAFAAGLNQAAGKNLGFLNPMLYPLANSAAFHNAASMSSDFTHVGLGSPNLGALAVALGGKPPGAVSPTASLVQAFAAPISIAPSGNGIPADGKTQGFVKVELIDANGNNISGKTVTIAAASGSHAVVSPSSAVTNVNNGAALFTVTDLTPESVTFTANDTTDGITPTQQATVPFVTPPATSASLSAFPTTVTADGKSDSTLTITMTDSLGRPTPGKVIAVTQGSGHSVISGPTPMVTDANGQLQLAASDTNSESVTYAATDVTDGNLPIPNQPSVTFSNAPNSGCAAGTPVGAPGLTVSAFATGFTAQAFNYGNVNWTCAGAFLPAFDASGNAYVADFPEGNIYKFPATGGVAGPATLLTTTPIGASLGQMVFDNGELYAAQGTASPTSFNNGSILQIDPTNGTVVRTVASGLTCTIMLAVDPLSGDLFTDDDCTGGGADNGAIWRISNPGGTTPTVSVYATLPNTGNAQLSFGPDGTLYVVTGARYTISGATVGSPTISVVSGTNGPTPPTVTTLSGTTSPQSVIALGTGASGGAQFLILTQTPAGASAPETTTFDLTPTPPITASILIPNGPLANYGNMELGPGGCLYGATNNAVFELTNNAGACLFTSTTQPPSLALTPPTLSPNPAQGSAQTLTAGFHYVTAPTGTPVTFQVVGANAQIASVNSDATGNASFTYTAAHQGVDTITAAATIAGTPISSNQSVITWGTGTDVTFLSLNPSQTSATEGQTANLVASLTDVSTNPPAPLGGQPINFSLGESSCGGTTNASGIASCQTAAGGAGSTTLSASFAGTSEYNASNASTGFNVIAPAPTATPTPVAGKLRVAPKHLNFGTVDVGSSKVKSVHITNLGKINKKRHPLPILIESESGAASPFSITQACADDDLNPRSKGVKPGTCEVSVTFTPAQATKYEGTLMIKDNLEPSFGQAVTLRGAGKTPK